MGDFDEEQILLSRRLDLVTEHSLLGSSTSEAFRVAEDGLAYDKASFVAHYGEDDADWYWDKGQLPT